MNDLLMILSNGSQTEINALKRTPAGEFYALVEAKIKEVRRSRKK